MANNNFRDNRPNLTKLPPTAREALTRPIPLREHELYGRFAIFKNTPGLVHPTARVLAVAYTPDEKATFRELCLELDASDFTGKRPLASFLVTKKNVPTFLAGAFRAFLKIGGTEQEILSALELAKAPATWENPVFNSNSLDYSIKGKE